MQGASLMLRPVVVYMVVVEVVFSGGHLLLVSPSADSYWLDLLAAEMGRED